MTEVGCVIFMVVLGAVIVRWLPGHIDSIGEQRGGHR